MATTENETSIVVDAKVFRFKFSNEITEMLMIFSQQHKYCNNEEFKQQWETWTRENINSIYGEKERLETLGYDGNIIEKMYKSIKYYYCKRNRKYKSESDTTTKNKDRKKYMKKNDDFISIIDTFIETHMERKEENGFVVKTCTTKPSHFWKEFNEDYSNELNDEVIKIIEEINVSENDATAKIRKMFNNRYFIKVGCHSNKSVYS